MNHHVVSTANSFSHTFLPACLPHCLWHKCWPPVTLIETPWSWDKFLLFHMLLLWCGLFLWVCKDESSLHRVCNPSSEKGKTQRENTFRKTEEEKRKLLWSGFTCLCALHEQQGGSDLGTSERGLKCQDVSLASIPSLGIQDALPCPLSPAWHASPAGDGEGVCPSTGMVVSGMCVFLALYRSSFKNNQAGKTAAAGKITLGRCFKRD